MDSSSSKDIILAVLSGSVSLAGLLLVFSGFLFSQATAFDPEHTKVATINRYRNAARFGVFPFIVCMALACISLWWLLSPSHVLLCISTIGFLATLVLTACYGAYVILKYL